MDQWHQWPNAKITVDEPDDDLLAEAEYFSARYPVCARCQFGSSGRGKYTHTAGCIVRRTAARLREVTTQRTESPCRWTEDADGNWDTACGAALCFENDPREDVHLGFCQNCGHPLELVSYVESVINEEDE